MEDAAAGAIMAARIAKDSKASNVVVMDLRDISYVTDYFVIGGILNYRFNQLPERQKRLWTILVWN